MSALQKYILKSGLPPKRPGAMFSSSGRQARQKPDYVPVAYSKYFDTAQDVATEGGTFRVYHKGHRGPVLVLLHGGGFSALTWSLLAAEVTNMVECQVLAIDLRGHGDSHTSDEEDLSANTLAKDVGDIIAELFKKESEPHPDVILVGHSMGGAVAVRAGADNLIPSLVGLAVIDVVEGSAMDALASMQSFLRGRPKGFKSLENAIEWSVRTGQIRNAESAKVSVPGQVRNVITGKLGTDEVTQASLNSNPGPNGANMDACTDTLLADMIDTSTDTSSDRMTSPTSDRCSVEPTNSCSIQEDIEEEAESLGDSNDKAVFKPPSPLVHSAQSSMDPGWAYTWRIDLGKTERFWSGWFQGLSATYLSVPVPKMLLLAGLDRLDKELTVGQMQGKFQMQVLPDCGHAVHEDVPDKVASVLANFMVRYKFAEPTDNFQRLLPGC